MPDLTLPTLLVTGPASQFRLRVCVAAWSSECGGSVGRYGSTKDGLVMLSAVGPDTAVKAVKALLHLPDAECEFTMEAEDSTERLVKARFQDKPVAWQASVVKLAPGAVHLVALAKVPGILPCMDDDRLWAELSGPRFTTPLLRPWTGWLKRAMIERGGIVMAEGWQANVGILTTTQEELDDIVSSGVRSGYLKMTAA